jgi:hypothetical protein
MRRWSGLKEWATGSAPMEISWSGASLNRGRLACGQVRPRTKVFVRGPSKVTQALIDFA